MEIKEMPKVEENSEEIKEDKPTKERKFKLNLATMKISEVTDE